MVSLFTSVALSCATVFCVDLCLKYRKAAAKVNHLPGIRVLFGPTHIIGNILPQIPFISAGLSHVWEMKRAIYDRVGQDVYGSIGLLPLTTAYYISDLDALKHIFSSRGTFIKHPDEHAIVAVFGPNLLSSEGKEWKRQRKIAAPAFSEKNNRLVHSATLEYVDAMIATWDRGTIHIPDLVDEVTKQVALCVIAKAAFGQGIKWGDDGELPEGHELTFKQALVTVTCNLIIVMGLPSWAYRLKKEWMIAGKARDELRLYLSEMISLRRASHVDQSVERHDLFNQLIHAHDDDDMLTEEELMSNVFLFLFAGHDTTANSLAFALGLLALYPDEQRKLYQQIREVQGDNNDFTYNDLQKFTYALAVFYETLRLYPVATAVHRRSSENTTITHTPHGTDQPASLSIQPDVIVGLNVLGVHYNPKYWDDPAEFVPARFMDSEWNRDAFLPFITGPRACIGRRFAETTAVTLLVRLLSKYKISVDETRFKLIKGEPSLKLRDRFFKATVGTTLVPGKIPLIFTPRD